MCNKNYGFKNLLHLQSPCEVRVCIYIYIDKCDVRSGEAGHLHRNVIEK